MRRYCNTAYLDLISDADADADLACDYANDRLDCPPFPIYAILFDGTSFEFFSFTGNTTPPTFSRGVFFRSPNSEPHQVLAVAHYRATSRIDFICSLRPICETFFYFLLLAYHTGIHAHTSRSLPHGRHERRPPRESTSTPGWKEAQEHARQALALAVDAAGKASARDPSADDIADLAVEQLEQRLRLIYS